MRGELSLCEPRDALRLEAGGLRDGPQSLIGGPGGVLRAVGLVLAAELTVTAVEELEHGRHVRWSVHTVADHV